MTRLKIRDSVLMLALLQCTKCWRPAPIHTSNRRSLACSQHIRSITSTCRWSSTSAETDSVVPTNVDSSSSSSSIPVVLLKRNRQSKSFRDGNQLVFSKSVDQVPLGVKMGDFVQVEVPDSDNPKNKQTQLIGWGVYNPNSMYQIRILQHAILLNNPKAFRNSKASPQELLEKLLAMQITRALQTRTHALGLPSATTDTYRLINGEGDGLSGLAVDVISNQVAVIMSSASWCQVHRTSIEQCLAQVLPNHELIWKTTASRLRQDGMEMDQDAENVDDDEGGADSFIDESDAPPVIALENGIKYRTYPHLKGQKTSVYCDQRENRWNLAQLCNGKSVLDLCCYHGGFSLNAAKQGATRVVGVDSSQEAIETCQSNAEMNGLDSVIRFEKADIADFMRTCQDSFDVVVLDPPKLAPSVAGLSKASRKYHSLNRDAIKLVNEEQGGILMTCTCSAAMTQKDGGSFFLQMVQQASLSAKRQVTLLRVSGAAPCHVQSPISFPAGNYLTAALFYVHPTSSA